MPCARRSGRNGLTLIEVVAGIAMLSTLLVGILAGFGRLSKQFTTSSRTREAIIVADDLLAAWYDSDAGVPRAGTGYFSDNGSFTWSTKVVDETLLPLGVVVVQLNVFNRIDGDALVTVDVLVSDDDQ